jgi:hypothetical protein
MLRIQYQRVPRQVVSSFGHRGAPTLERSHPAFACSASEVVRKFLAVVGQVYSRRHTRRGPRDRL